MLKKCVALMLMGVFAVSLGCQKKDGEGGSSKVDAKKRLVGKWELDGESILESALKNAKDDKEKEAMKAQAEMMTKMMKFSLEFKEDGKANMTNSAMGKTESHDGTFEVVSQESDSVIITVNNLGKNAPGKIKFSFLGDDKVKMEPTEAEDLKNVPPFDMIFKRSK